MPRQYVIKAGDCIASVAMERGFFPTTLWDHPANAELKALRNDGNVLQEGDVLLIPDLREKCLSCATGRRHRFRRRGVPEMLKITLHRRGKPRADLPYQLEIDGRQVASARTDAEGRIEHFIPPNAMRGRLILGEIEVYELALGRLEPACTEVGARARLVNLDLLVGADADAKAYEAALVEFQIQNDLAPSGRLDPATQAKLVDVHGR